MGAADEVGSLGLVWIESEGSALDAAALVDADGSPVHSDAES